MPRRGRRWIGAAGTAATLVVTFLVATPPRAVAATAKPPAPQPMVSVHGSAAHTAHIPIHDDAATAWKPPAVSWPAAGSATVDLGVAAAPGRRSSGTPLPSRVAPDPSVPASVPAGALPVSVGRITGRSAPTQIRVDLASHAGAQAAGVNGVLLSATGGAGAGEARMTVDTSGFAGAFGGNFAQRLRLVELPACALSTPRVAACQRQTPLPTTDGPFGTLSTDLTFAGPAATSAAAGRAPVGGRIVLAATSAPSGDAGDYTATPLKPSGTWTSGGNTGDFTYSYPIDLPPVAGSELPSVSLEYDSQSVDGEQVSTNSQPSWVGDGWDYSAGYIERTYTDCADDPAGTAPKTGDMCWLSDAAPLHLDLDGHSGDLVFDGTNYKIVGDSGEKVVYQTGGSNGTNDGGYFEIIDQSGTQYYFGRNHLPGYTSDTATPPTNSAWTVPVYGAHTGDPCHGSTFATSVCTQAWRWNLDYVVDTHHNAIAYYYKTETNFYAEDLGAHNVSYMRGGYLDHIDYGLVDPNPYTGNGGHAPAQVAFGVSERCVVTGTETCATGNITSKPADWPDVPADQICNSGATCNTAAPTFFSRKRLTTITSQIWNGTSYGPVDTWTLTQSFPNPGDTTSASLWLASIQRTGKDGTAVSLPALSFAGTLMANRIDGPDNAPAMNHNRVATITTETGEVINIAYSSQAAPCVSPVTISPSTNTALCYPVYWTPSGFQNPSLDWFAKYVVNEIDEQDPTGGAPAVATNYTYLDGAAWHYDDNETVKSKYRTWGQFRGYDRVQTTTGAGSDAKTLSETYFYRGMNGDTLPNGGTRAVNVALSPNVTIHGATSGLPATSAPDTNQLAGQAREQIDYSANMADSAHVVDATVTDYWVSGSTATRTRNGLPSLTANIVRPVATYTATAITQNSPVTFRTTETDTTYNTSTGLPTVVYDYGDIGQPSQRTCAVTTYAPANTGANLVNLEAEVETDAVGCGGSGVNGLTAPTTISRPADVISDKRTYYDDPTFSQTWPQPTPTVGNDSLDLVANNYTTSFQYQVSSRATYDSYGRRLIAYDGRLNPTTNTYTMTNGLPTQTAVANALGQKTTTTYDPARGLPTKIVDPNNQQTSEAYDGLGRLTKVWLPGNATSNPANNVYTYLVQAGAASAVTAQVLDDNGTYRTAVTLYDALDRQRQTQTQTPVGGRLLTDNFYDSRGYLAQVNHEYWDASTGPSTSLLDMRGHDNQIPDQDAYTFDGMGREVLDASKLLGVTQWQSQTVYGGDRTTKIPPTGGTPTTTIVDGRDRTIEQDSYKTMPTVAGTRVTGGTFNKITYGFDHRGNPATTTDDAGATWTATHNLLGQVTASSDPDQGATPAGSPSTYDGDGNLLTATDSRGHTITNAYDALNRRTAQYDGPNTSSPLIATWSYDSATIANGIGQVASSTTYDPPGGANAYVVATNGYTSRGKPTGSTVTIPAGAGATANGSLAGAYTFTNTYSTTNQLLTKTAFPATTGALPSENVNFGYDSMDHPTTVGSLSGTYVFGTTYNQFGLVSQVQVNSVANRTTFTNVYDQHTNRLAEVHTDRTTTPTRLDDVTYTYDAAGLITREVDTRNDTTADAQCFDYDLLGQLSNAWTATDNCAADVGATGSNATVGDPAGGAYWSSYSYNGGGNRTQEVDHHLPGQTGDTTTTYTYPGVVGGLGQPDTLTSTSTTGPSGSSSTSYQYDTAGNTTTRTTPAFGTQHLTWNDAGQLGTVAGTGTSTYTYDAAGDTLIERDPGTVTLFLPGEELVLHTATSTTTGARYYPGPGDVTAVRTGTAITAYSFLVTDQNGTGYLSLDNTGQVATWRQFTPFGAPRGSVPGTWPDTHQYLDKPADAATGLDIFGVRQFDPTIGRFVSADPVFDSGDATQIGGYTYAGNDPITNADPDGKWGFHIHIHLGSVLHAVATVASVVSIIPGPIGMVASGVAAVSYAATGDWKNAAIMAAGVALSAVGAGAAATVASKAVKAAELATDTARGLREAGSAAKAAREVNQAARGIDDLGESRGLSRVIGRGANKDPLQESIDEAANRAKEQREFDENYHDAWENFGEHTVLPERPEAPTAETTQPVARPHINHPDFERPHSGDTVSSARVAPDTPHITAAPHPEVLSNLILSVAMLARIVAIAIRRMRIL